MRTSEDIMSEFDKAIKAIVSWVKSYESEIKEWEKNETPNFKMIATLEAECKCKDSHIADLEQKLAKLEAVRKAAKRFLPSNFKYDMSGELESNDEFRKYKQARTELQQALREVEK